MENVSLLSARSVAELTIAFYWPVLVAEGIIVAFRAFFPKPQPKWLMAGSAHSQRLEVALHHSASWLPAGVWAWLAERQAMIVNNTHASVYPGQILTSMQCFIGALVLLSAVLLVDAVSLASRRQRLGLEGQSILTPLPVVILILAPIVDWFFLCLTWWLYFVSSTMHA